MHNPRVDAFLASIYSRWGVSRWWPVAVGIVCCWWASAAATESLWLDELHTSWTVADGLGDVAARARAGNQSPLFFWLLFAVTETLGNFSSVAPEWLLRSPSIVCFAGVALLCLREAGLASHERPLGLPAMAVALCVWLLLDRIQIFYASEARVYSSVQLVSLVGWLAVWRMRTASGYGCAWCILSSGLVFLHITAVLAVVSQALWGTLLMYRRPTAERWRWAGAVGVALIAATAALLLSVRVWVNRGQWDAFAGEATAERFIGLFPLLAYMVPVGAVRIVDWLCRPDQPRVYRADTVASVGSVQQGSDLALSYRTLWCLAAGGPWCAAWLITALDVAPIFHRRFVIVSAVPLVMLAAVEVARIRRPSLRWTAVLGVALWLVVSQGTLANWRAGHWFGWQRWEGWRQASLALSRRIQPGDELWCASGLVEASNAKIPLDEPQDQYLSFPLRGVYAIEDSAGSTVEPRALLLSGAEWAAQLSQAQRPAVAEPLDVEPSKRGRTVWIVYRGTRAGFRQRLDAMFEHLARLSDASWQLEPPQSFGLVSMARIEAVGQAP